MCASLCVCVCVRDAPHLPFRELAHAHSQLRNTRTPKKRRAERQFVCFKHQNSTASERYRIKRRADRNDPCVMWSPCRARLKCVTGHRTYGGLCIQFGHVCARASRNHAHTQSRALMWFIFLFEIRRTQRYYCRRHTHARTHSHCVGGNSKLFGAFSCSSHLPNICAPGRV